MYSPASVTSPKTNGMHRNERRDSIDSSESAKEIDTISLLRSSASTTTIKSVLGDEIDAAQGESKGVAPSPANEVKSPSLSTQSLVSTESVDSASASVDENVLNSNGNSVTSKVEADLNQTTEEKTHEIRIENAADEVQVLNEFVPNEKSFEIEESKTDSESTRSFASSEDAALTPLSTKTPRETSTGKQTNRFRAPPLMRFNKIAPSRQAPPVGACPLKFVSLFPNHLRKFEKPRDAANNCLSQLESSVWETTMNGLQIFVRLIRHHPEMIESNFHAFCVTLARHVKNLRSQVSRSACQASAEFYQTHAKQMELEPDDLATQLFHRTADTNKFLRADAMRALNAMCDNLPPHKVIQTIVTRGALHQNAIVRCASANLFNRIVSRMGANKVFALPREFRDKFIITGANFLMEGSLETRNHAKAFFKQLSSHPHYHRILFDVIPQRTYRNIEKALKAIK